MATAADGQIYTLPSPTMGPPPRTNGLTVELDLTARVGIGYVPIKVTIDAAAPAPGPRRLSIRFESRGLTSRQREIQTSQELEIPAGDRRATTVVHVAELLVSDLRFDFWDQGEHLPDLSSILTRSRPGNGYGPAVLLLASSGLQPTAGDFWEHTLTISRQKNQSHYAPYDLPESMVDYSQWAVVMIPLDELEYVVTQRRAAWSALRQWIVSGGNLMVYGLADMAGELPRLNRLLELSDYEPADPNNTQGKPGEPFWQLPLVDLDQLLNMDHYVLPQNDPDVEKQLQQRLAALRKRLSGRPYLRHSLALGTVAALDTTEPTSEPEEYWKAIQFEQGGTLVSNQRRDVNYAFENSRYWDFLIPGVGLAPIGAFEALIALFVIGVGPMNYYFLRRRHQQSLLLLTVPACAGLFTGGLLFYAVVADGFGVSARARSFTEIDQRHGEAICWSRIAYYAGRQPADGLEFSLDTEVYPVDWQPTSQSGQAQRVREIDEGARRRLGSSWLPVRTQTQLLTVRGRRSESRLEITGRVADKDLRAVNHLGTRIQRLLVVDDDRALAWHEGLDEGQSAPIAEIDLGSAQDRLNQQLELQLLKVPKASVLNGTGPFDIRRRANVFYSVNPAEIGAMLELGLQFACAVDYLPPRTYVATVDCSPEFELGLPAADMK
ncbi:MAG TPA: hypothetical protein VHY20_06780, partial [Pirellulales bacterium]|nr:hypothetical protein [Pirellulales bacterium]